MSEDRYQIGEHGFLYDTWPDPPQVVVSAVGNSGPIAPIISDEFLDLLNGWTQMLSDAFASAELLARSRAGWQHDAEIATALLRNLMVAYSPDGDRPAMQAAWVEARAYLGSMRGAAG